MGSAHPTFLGPSRPNQKVDVFRHNDPCPKVESMLSSRVLQCLDKPEPRSVFAQQGHPPMAREGEKMGVPRFVEMTNLLPPLRRVFGVGTTHAETPMNTSMLPESTSRSNRPQARPEVNGCGCLRCTLLLAKQWHTNLFSPLITGTRALSEKVSNRSHAGVGSGDGSY